MQRAVSVGKRKPHKSKEKEQKEQKHPRKKGEKETKENALGIIIRHNYTSYSQATPSDMSQGFVNGTGRPATIARQMQRHHPGCSDELGAITRVEDVGVRPDVEREGGDGP
ncbi:hypothetical protein GALMADRAFT_1162912 [Galerina marginata CBS 339.88]|uniref:Uncharacterized protein n=2 Tax=Galerina marginata (strain CBS 339.88) TaxID=685588 RepID=A0A067TBK5_GALM3|nr:hypothetical protein GALMADRAFT_1162912 [Galerina marginata CBS 339.88]